MSTNESLAPDGPFKLEMQVFFKVTAGPNAGMDAWASIELEPGVVPTAEVIKDSIKKVQEQVGRDYTLADRKQFVSELLAEMIGHQVAFAVPGPNTFTLVD